MQNIVRLVSSNRPRIPFLSLVFQRLLHHTRVFANCVLHTHIHATYEHTFNIYIYIYTSRNDGNLVTKDRPIKQIFTLPVSFNRRVQLQTDSEIIVRVSLPCVCARVYVPCVYARVCEMVRCRKKVLDERRDRTWWKI